MVLFFFVSEPTTDIIGAPDLYIDRGSTINLTCVVLYSPEPPAYIYWNHNDAVSFFDTVRKCEISEVKRYRVQQIHTWWISREIIAAMLIFVAIF